MNCIIFGIFGLAIGIISSITSYFLYIKNKKLIKGNKEIEEKLNSLYGKIRKLREVFPEISN